MYKVLMCGDRHWTRMSAIEREVKRLIKKHGTKNLLLIEGGAPGADQMIRYVGHKHNVHVAEVKALWETRHNSAGPQRNAVMLALDPHEVIAFHPDLAKSTGTKDMIRQVRRAGYEPKVVKR